MHIIHMYTNKQTFVLQTYIIKAHRTVCGVNSGVECEYIMSGIFAAAAAAGRATTCYYYFMNVSSSTSETSQPAAAAQHQQTI